MKRSSQVLAGLAAFNVLWIAGCGGESAPPPAAAKATTTSAATVPDKSPPAPLPETAAEHVASTATAPDKSTPEWLVLEMTRLRVEPLVRQEAPKDGEQIQTVSASVDVEALRNAARERNLEIAALAEEAIALTHDDPARERLFNAAVHHLTEARLQLALQGDQAQIDALYESADLLKQRDQKSKAAAEAAFALVKYTETNARKFADREPTWLEHFARQARLFATDFPQEAVRAISMLDAAAWSCEVHGLSDEAIACYRQIHEQYREHPQAQHIGPIMRRLQLNGQPLQLRGTTFDGGELRIEDLRGQTVLVAFWAAGQNGFEQQIPALQAAAAKYSDQGLVIVGVNLDTDEPALQAFLEQHDILWPNVFFVDPARRGWNNPIVQYYGVRNIPAYWLVNADGKVIDTRVDLKHLDKVLPPLLQASKDADTPSTGE